MEDAVERKTRLACRCRPFRGLALALFALSAVFSTAAQAMLLTLDLRWTDASRMGGEPTGADPYNLQAGSIIQVIAVQKGADFSDDAAFQFGAPYGTTSDTNTPALPYSTNHVPTDKQVYLADSTPDGHSILYTGAIEPKGSWYGLYTQITVDDWLYDRVYIRVFGATDIAQGVVTASYWGVSTPHPLSPNYQHDTLAVTDFVAGCSNYFEVIPEPATMGLLGVGGVALAAWRRRRFLRTDANGTVREED